jgi:two-component system chemotaxis response regulator CheY
VKTVLVVDDDSSIRRFITIALERRGWAVLEAEDGVDGVARALLHQPDVIITDLSMPKQDGFEMIDALKASDAITDVRLVIMSGVLDLTKEMAKATGAAALLRKPFTLDELYSAVGDSGHAKT